MREWPIFVCLFMARGCVEGHVGCSLGRSEGHRDLKRRHDAAANLIYVFPRSRLIDRQQLELAI